MKKQLISKILCLALAVITLFSLAGCGKADGQIDVKGVWLAQSENDEKIGYSLDGLIDIGEEVESGFVKVFPYERSYFTAYRYIYTSSTKITIRKYDYELSGDKTVTDYDTLCIKWENGKRVLVSTKTGIQYYYAGPVEY